MSSLPSITIAGRRIASDEPPFVIAELSANHNGRLDTALRIIEEAKKAGADAVKLQTYRPDTITLDSDAPDFQIHGGLWDGKTLYALYQEAHMPWNGTDRCSSERARSASRSSVRRSTPPRWTCWKTSGRPPTRSRPSRPSTSP